MISSLDLFIRPFTLQGGSALEYVDAKYGDYRLCRMVVIITGSPASRFNHLLGRLAHPLRYLLSEDCWRVELITKTDLNDFLCTTGFSHELLGSEQSVDLPASELSWFDVERLLDFNPG